MSLALWILSQILGIIILLVGAAYIYFKYFIFNYWKKRGVPGPKPTFPFGNFMAYVTRTKAVGETIEELYNECKHHRFFGIYIFFKPNLIVVDPDLIKDVLIKEFGSFHDRGIYYNEKVDPLSGTLFQLPGKKWRNLRVQMMPLFTTGKMKQIFFTVKECGDTLSRFVKRKVEASEPINVTEMFSRYTTDAIVSSAFGISCNSVEDPHNEFRYWTKQLVAPQAIKNTLAILAPQILYFLSIPYFPRGLSEFLTQTFKSNVEYREKHNVVRKDLMNLLMQLMKNGMLDADADSNMEKEEIEASIESSEIRHKFTMQEATAQALLFLFGGFETSALTSSFCLFELALNQDIQDKVRAEIRTVLQKHGEITYEAINEMNYFHKVVCETMRKYSPIPVMNRVCTKDIDLPSTNLRVRKGTYIMIPIDAIHHDSRYFPEPKKFDPERFSEESIAARHPFVYLPFGAGSRKCIGGRLGFMQVKVGLINVLHKYKVKISPKMTLPVEFEKGVLLTSPKNVHLIAEPA